MESTKKYTTKSGNVITASRQPVEMAGQSIGMAIVARWERRPSEDDKAEGMPILEQWAREWAAMDGKEIAKVASGSAATEEEAQQQIGAAIRALAGEEASIFIGECECGSPTCGTISLGIQNGEVIEKSMNGEIPQNVVGIRSMNAPRVIRLVEKMLVSSLRNMPLEAIEMDMDTLTQRVKAQVQQNRADVMKEVIQ